MMKGYKLILTVLILIALSNISETVNAQLIRFEVSVEKSPVPSDGSIYFTEEGMVNAKENGRTKSISNGCLAVVSQENITVLVRASMNEQTADAFPTIIPRYINNGDECPDSAKRLYEVSHPFLDGQAIFHLNELQTPKRSTPGIKGEVVSYLTLVGYSTPGAWMKAGELNMGERDTGVSFTIEIEYL